jgi:hypothetical protein
MAVLPLRLSKISRPAWNAIDIVHRKVQYLRELKIPLLLFTCTLNFNVGLYFIEVKIAVWVCCKHVKNNSKNRHHTTVFTEFSPKSCSFIYFSRTGPKISNIRSQNIELVHIAQKSSTCINHLWENVKSYWCFCSFLSLSSENGSET